VTSAHNLRDRTTQLTFTGTDGRQVQASLVGVDVDTDLAVLAADTGDAPPAAWASAAPEPGDVVFAASAPGGVRVAFGAVTGTSRQFRGPRGRRVNGAFEHTVPLARGASGGPVLDAEGRVLGLDTHRLEGGFYLALPAGEDLQARLGRLAAGERLEGRRLGVAVAPAHVARRLRKAVGLPEQDGLLVRSVVDGSPARTAGLDVGDLLVRAGDRELRHPDDLADVLDSVSAGGTVTVAVVRGTEERTVEVHFPEPQSDDGNQDEASSEGEGEGEGRTDA
jgi:S1-C subfamily serine protease